MAQNQSGYTDAQIRSMQQDAVRRVNEMQRMARQRVDTPSGQQRPPNQQKPPDPKEPCTNPIAPEPCMQPTLPIQNGLIGFLDRMNLDEEKILLIGILILLINEGADTYLILALVYILI